jgi:hypothetical protein
MPERTEKNRLVDLSTVNEAYSVSVGLYLGYHTRRGGSLKIKAIKSKYWNEDV